jgi:hypothetical protein
MESELRTSAVSGLLLRKDDAAAHLAEARRHLEEAWKSAHGEETPDGPQTPAR